MDIAALKQHARTLEQQGSTGEALEVYRQILSELDALGAIRQELPLLIKIGDLLLKAGDVDGGVDMYERAASEYATQGAAQPVMSLCIKIVRADAQAVGAYLRLARRLLEGGHTDGAREVLMDYAERAKLEKTSQGLERLAGLADDEVKRVLAKAIDTAEERAPKRAPRPPAPPQVAAPPPEPVEPPPPPEEPPPRKRLTVPVGALDAEPDPSLLELHPPEPRPEPREEPGPESLFPTAEDLQAPVMPGMPAAFAPPPAPPPPPPPPLPVETTFAPPPMEGMLSTTFPEPPAPQPPAPPQPRLSVPMMEAVLEPPPAAPPPPPGPGPAQGWPDESARASRPQPRTSRPSMRAPTHAHAHAPVRASRGAPRGLLPFISVVAVVGVVGALLWFRVIPLDRLRNLLPKGGEPTQVAPPEPRPTVAPPPDTVMARDTATVGAPTRPARAAAQPAAPPEEQPAPPPAPPTLPPGVALTRPVMVVGGLQVESVSEIESEGRAGIAIVQLLGPGQRIFLEEFPTDTVGAAGEIGVTGLPPDTVVGHVRMADLEIRLKAVISEDRVVQLLQQLVEVKP